MNYQETLDWMFSRLPAYQKQGKKAFNAKMDGIINFTTYLKNPHTKFKSIHVAGTNGKGSSSHMIASILQEAGYKVGLYTSPHLRDFRERIKINGVEISEEEVVAFILKHQDYLDTEGLSFFEMTVGMAFDYFAQEQVDYAVIEVGLGGRLDSTNIICPEICLITNIGLDHTAMLGDTLEQIAAEKAGIIKTNTPVIISEYQKETWPVFEEKSKKEQAPITLAKDYTYKSDLAGVYQSKNINGVVELIKSLPNKTITEVAIKNGLLKVKQNTGLQGRWQQLKEVPLVICDTAHNKEGLTLVMKQLRQQNYNQLHIVLGVVNDKSLEDILPLFPKQAQYYFCKPNIPRGLEVDVLQQQAQKFGLPGEKYNTVSDAYQKALANAVQEDLIYIGGSTFVVAEVV